MPLMSALMRWWGSGELTPLSTAEINAALRWMHGMDSDYGFWPCLPYRAAFLGEFGWLCFGGWVCQTSDLFVGRLWTPQWAHIVNFHSIQTKLCMCLALYIQQIRITCTIVRYRWEELWPWWLMLGTGGGGFVIFLFHTTPHIYFMIVFKLF